MSIKKVSEKTINFTISVSVHKKTSEDFASDASILILYYFIDSRIEIYASISSEPQLVPTVMSIQFVISSGFSL